MPELDGYEATGRIRAKEGDARHTWIVAMTAHAMPGDRDKCLAAGMDDYVAKPMTLESMRAAIERFAARGETPIAAEKPTPARLERRQARDASRLLEASRGNPAVLQRLKDLYRTFVAEQLAALRVAVLDRSAEDIERIAHRCIGASAVAGMNQLADLFEELEGRARQRDLAPMSALLGRAEQEFAETKLFLEQLGGTASAAA
jgi:response regulator RpfG family c-di-GMP phosphodiesterase